MEANDDPDSIFLTNLLEAEDHLEDRQEVLLITMEEEEVAGDKVRNFRLIDPSLKISHPLASEFNSNLKSNRKLSHLGTEIWIQF